MAEKTLLTFFTPSRNRIMFETALVEYPTCYDVYQVGVLECLWRRCKRECVRQHVQTMARLLLHKLPKECVLMIIDYAWAANDIRLNATNGIVQHIHQHEHDMNIRVYTLEIS